MNREDKAGRLASRGDIRPPRTYRLLFVGVFIAAVLFVFFLDLYYVLAQGEPWSDLLVDLALATVLITILVLVAYFTLKRVLVRYMESERMFRELAESLPEAVFEADDKGLITYANQSALDWFGYTREELEKGDLEVLQMVAEEDRERAVGNIVRLFKGELSGSRSYMSRRRDGSTFPVMISTIPVFRDGKPAGLRGVIVDITEQQKADEAIRASEKKYRELADSLPQVVFETDIDANVKYVNVNAFKMFGFSEEALERGINVADVMEDPDTTLSDIRLMIDLRIEEIAREYTARREDGSTFPVMISAKLVFESGEPVGIRGILTDITEQKRTEARLRDSESRYKSLFESSIDGIVVTNLEGRIIEANQAYLDMLGYSAEDIEGVTYRDLTPRAYWQMEMDVLRDQVLERGYSDEYEKEGICKDGATIPLSIRRWLIRDEGGEPVGMWSIARDVSELKKRERELELVNAELVGYAHTVSHDLKNPIHNVMMACYTIENLLRKPRTSETEGYMDESLAAMKAGLERANNLIEDILILAESGQVPKDVVEVDVASEINAVLRERSDEIHARGIDIVQDDDLGTIVAAPTHVYQVFSNLIKNAVQYNDSPDPRIEIHSVPAAGAGMHRYLVRDNGSGIPEEMLPSVFIPFTRGESGDTGIGLSIVNRIVEVYGGEVRAYNDRGACFEFTLRDFTGD